MKTYTAVLAFKDEETRLALVNKNRPDLPHIHAKWNGIGGEIDPGESPVGAAVREFREETGIALGKDDLVAVEHQRFDILTPNEYHIYWYAANLDGREAIDTWLPTTNDVGELMRWALVKYLLPLNRGAISLLAPNLDYLIPKAITYLRTPYLARPA